jgi:hypothetical protein
MERPKKKCILSRLSACADSRKLVTCTENGIRITNSAREGSPGPADGSVIVACFAGVARVVEEANLWRTGAEL